MEKVDTGIVVAFAGNNVPTGWAICDGSVHNKNEQKWKALFEAIGTIHGGDGNPNFQLPDYRGMFLRGVDSGAGRDPDSGGRIPPGHNNTGNSGDLVGSIQDDEFRSHDHVINSKHLEASGGSGFDGAGFDSNSNNGGPYQHPYDTGQSGGKETRPKNAYVTYIIKL